jgi:hypothetical protein
MDLRRLTRFAAVAAACFSAPAWGAAPETIEALETPALDGLATPPPSAPYALDTEMVVKNWVLCISQDIAEELVRAREESAEKALSTYAGFQEARSCGQFPELRVILRERLYVSGSADFDGRVFGGLVNLSGAWASAFIVSGGLPD